MPLILCFFLGFFSFEEVVAQQAGDIICFTTNSTGTRRTSVRFNGLEYRNNNYHVAGGELRNNKTGLKVANSRPIDCDTGEVIQLDENNNVVTEGEGEGEGEGDYDEANAENLEEIAGTLEEILDELDGGENPYLNQNLPTDSEKPVKNLDIDELEYNDENEIPEIEDLEKFQMPDFGISSGASLGVIELAPNHTLDIGGSYNELSGTWGFKDITTFMAVFSILIFTFYRAQTMFAH